MAGIDKKRQLTPVQEVVATYDFAVDGGAVSTISSNVTFQKGTVIWQGYVRVLTALTSSASGTLSIKVVGAGDIVADAAVSGAPWSTTGLKDVVPVGTAATAVEVTTQGTALSFVIATGALTAGKLEVHLWVTQNINILS